MASDQLPSSDINSPDHQADGAELSMGFVAIVVAFILATVITGFYPGRN